MPPCAWREGKGGVGWGTEPGPLRTPAQRTASWSPRSDGRTNRLTRGQLCFSLSLSLSTVELGTGLRSDSTAKQLLNSMKVTFDEVQLDRIDSGPQMQDALKEITGQRTVSALLSLEPAAAARLTFVASGTKPHHTGTQHLHQRKEHRRLRR